MNILWDFDGTLFNTYPAYTKILTEALGRDIPEVEVFAMLKVSFGHAFRYFGLSDEQEKEMRTNVRSMEPDEFQPFPGLVEVLKKADKNVIMTHKERDDVMKVLKFHQMDAYFSDLVAGDDGYPRKPHPASYEYLHQKHRIDLVVGDREIDVMPGKQLGIRTCLFQNDAGDADYYLKHYVDFDLVVGRFLLKK